MRTFSEITDQDLAQVTELWERRTSSRATGNVTEYIAAGRNHRPQSLLGRGGEVVCGAMVGFTGQRGWINEICVDERFQRRGFERAIVAAAETWLTERGAPNIRLKVPYTHPAAIGFYDKLGYRFQHTVVLGKLVQAGAHDANKLELL